MIHVKCGHHAMQICWVSVVELLFIQRHSLVLLAPLGCGPGYPLDEGGRRPFMGKPPSFGPVSHQERSPHVKSMTSPKINRAGRDHRVKVVSAEHPAECASGTPSAGPEKSRYQKLVCQTGFKGWTKHPIDLRMVLKPTRHFATRCIDLVHPHLQCPQST